MFRLVQWENRLTTALALAVACATVSHASAALLTISSPTFAKLRANGGVYVPFTAAGSASWSTPLVDNIPYSVNSVSLIKSSTSTTAGVLWVVVYTSLVGNGSLPGNLRGFLGASIAGVDFGGAANGSNLTWTFADIEVSSGPTWVIYLVLQPSAALRDALMTFLGDSAAIRRMPDGITAAAGAGILQPNTGPRNDRAPLNQFEVSVVPEPASLAVAPLAGLALLRRRR